MSKFPAIVNKASKTKALHTAMPSTLEERCSVWNEDMSLKSVSEKLLSLGRDEPGK